jgi:CRP/FNR family transcriptional regulator
MSKISYPLEETAQKEFLAASHILPHIQGLPRYLLSACLSMRSYPKGKSIFQEDDDGTCLYILLKGEVLIYKLHKAQGQTIAKDNKKTHLTILGPGKVFGEMACLDKTQSKRSASAQAIRQTSLFMLDVQIFDVLCNTFPALTFDLLVYDLATRVRENNAHVEILMSMQRSQRVARFLIDMANQRGEVKGAEIHFDLGMSQAMAAKLLNMSDAALSKQLAILEDDKVIRRQSDQSLNGPANDEKGQPKTFRIIDMIRLLELAKITSK